MRAPIPTIEGWQNEGFPTGALYIEETEQYVVEKDVLGAVNVKLNFGPGDFTAFYPNDAHIPKLRTGDTPNAVKKAVFKIRI